MLSSIFMTSFLFGASFAAQSSPTVVCVAGQCLQGYTNTTIGATLSASGAATSILLLPGQYTSSSDPELLHNLLTTSGASLVPSPGFEGNFSLPLNLALQAGVVVYPQPKFSGQANFAELPSSPSNSSSQISPGSLAVSSNVWAAISSSSSSDRVIFWDSVPDVTQLPSSAAGLSELLEIQSSACSPPCSGAGVCSASGTCVCPPGFNGASCETCAKGFFGSSCQACPAGCGSCDDGMAGTGRCLEPVIENLPSTCNCLNGQCNPDGSCACLPGWTTATNGTSCAKCASGFFLNSGGNCEVCSLGCNQCADGSGVCIACKSGFTQNANDRTSCFASQSTTSTGTQCPDGSFSDGSSCQVCSPLCTTCTGPSSSECIICGNGKFTLNGNCVGTDGNGVCDGSSLVADNNKHECDSCPSGCTTCKYPTFSVASTIDQVQCTGCLPGFVLSKGKCVEKCPTGTFVDPKDNITCTACDSSCGTCAGSSTFCLTCANNQLASNGKCVASCPSNSFSSSGQCISCHPDCATCSGSSFNQCSSCPADRPVLTNGRCLPTCSKSQFFDKTSSACQSCDASCSSCSGAGPSNCLACSSSSHILRGGTCVSANCNGSSGVVAGLGLCLSDLVVVPTKSGEEPPLPSVTGIDTPTSSNNTQVVRRPLEWWQILLMALGCAFIFILVLMCWRRRARKRRAAATANFAAAKRIDHPRGWRLRLARFGEKLFGHKSQGRWMLPHDDDIRLQKLRAAEEARLDRDRGVAFEKLRVAEEQRHERDVSKLRASEARHTRDVDNILDAYRYSRPGDSSRAPSPLPSLRSYDGDRLSHHKAGSSRSSEHARAHALATTDKLARESLYQEVTGQARRAPEPRQPVRGKPDVPSSRFSGSTTYSSWLVPDPPAASSSQTHLAPTPAQEYARSVSHLAEAADEPFQRGAYWLQPTHTGTSGGSRNPFLR